MCDRRVFAYVDERKSLIADVCGKIWEYAEAGGEEIRSSRLLMDILAREGFTVQEQIADIPTAFCASFGTGHPVVGLLAEYDALPGLSQEAGVPERKPLAGTGYGHGCGHNQIAAGVLAAALAVKDFMAEKGFSGTLRVYGCPAEETEGCKRILVEKGCFEGVDCAFSWHPAWYTSVMANGMAAAAGADISFTGVSSHAAVAPELGRSALDAVELLNVGCNYLREHIPADVKLQYAYQDAGGTAANIIPDHACIRYQLRGKNLDEVRQVMERIRRAAQGAALMTDTEMHFEELQKVHEYLPNPILGGILEEALQLAGAPEYDAADFQLAESLFDTFSEKIQNDIHQMVRKRYGISLGEELWSRKLFHVIDSNPPTAMIYGSSDIGDVSAVLPVAQIRIASTCLGTANHTWQMVAMGNSPVAYKACCTAGKVLSLACVRVFCKPEIAEKAKQYLMSRE